MTPSNELQKAIYERLTLDARVSGVVGDKVYDGRPDEGQFPCITFGPSDYIEDDSECITGRIETMQIDCWVRDGRRLHPAKELADYVKSALHLADLTLDEHALVFIRVSSVRAMMDSDGQTGHGIVMVEAHVEED